MSSENKKIPVAWRCGYCGSWLDSDDNFPEAFEKKGSVEGVDYEIRLGGCSDCGV